MTLRVFVWGMFFLCSSPQNNTQPNNNNPPTPNQSVDIGVGQGEILRPVLLVNYWYLWKGEVFTCVLLILDHIKAVSRSLVTLVPEYQTLRNTVNHLN